MEDIKPVVKEKYKFEYRYKSMIKALFASFWTIKILQQGSKWKIFESSLKEGICGSDQACGYREMLA